VVLASLLLNQFASVYEFYTDSSIYSSSIEIQYETNRSEEAMLEGMVREESYRAMGFFDNSLKLASLLCMTLPFAMFLSVYGANTLTRVFAALSVAMAIPTAFFTGSRTAIGIMIIIFGWYMYRLVSRGMSRIGRRTLFTCSLPLAAIFIVTATSGIIDEILFGDIYARSTDARWTQFITVPIFIAEYPMFGRGYARNIGEVISMATLDSFYLRITLEGGVVALLALAVFLFRGSRILFPLSKTDHGDFDTSLAKALRVSTGISAILMIVFSLAYVRMYVFMAVAIAVVLHSLCSKNNATGPITDAGPTLPQSQPVKQ
jgi:hypothetical protein